MKINYKELHDRYERIQSFRDNQKVIETYPVVKNQFKLCIGRIYARDFGSKSGLNSFKTYLN